MHSVGQQAHDHSDDLIGPALSSINGHHILGHREDAAGAVAAVTGVGDQMYCFPALDLTASILGVSILIPAALVPSDATPDRHQQAPVDINPVEELGVLRSVPDERFVGPTHRPVEILSDPKATVADPPE